MLLTSPEVNGVATERTVLGLFAEFLGRYFDGTPHDVGSVKNVAFPKAKVIFQQADPGGNEVLIHMVWIKPGRVQRGWDTVGSKREMVKKGRCAWVFFVKVRVQPGAEGSSKDVVMQVSGLLSGLLGNSYECRVLSQKGIGRLRPDLPALVSDGEQYQVRQVGCSGEVWWKEGWKGR